jgi:hypothetical protein
MSGGVSLPWVVRPGREDGSPILPTRLRQRGLGSPALRPVQGTSDLRVIKMMLLRRLQGLEPAVASDGAEHGRRYSWSDEWRERAGAWSVWASRGLIWDGASQAPRVFWLPVEPFIWGGGQTPDPNRFVSLQP